MLRRHFSTVRLYNALTHEVEPILLDKQKPLLWYACGPTVYDEAHLGHARTYVSHDVLYRALSRYFGYNVVYVMGMTDVDDKIISVAKV